MWNIIINECLLTHSMEGHFQLKTKVINKFTDLSISEIFWIKKNFIHNVISNFAQLAAAYGSPRPQASSETNYETHIYFTHI